MTGERKTLAVIAAQPVRQCVNAREIAYNDDALRKLSEVASTAIDVVRFAKRVRINAFRQTPLLAECEPMSFLGAIMQCAQLGLEPNTALGHAYLIPFKRKRKVNDKWVEFYEAQLIMGYKGMIALARRSGAIASIHADVVYEGDEFSCAYGSNQHLHHVPMGKRENPLCAYAYARLTDGEAFVRLPWEVVLQTRDESQGYRKAVADAKKFGKPLEQMDSPWVKHLHAMAAKTAVRALFKELPISTDDMETASSVDDRRMDYAGFANSPDDGALPATDDEGNVIIDVEPTTETKAHPPAQTNGRAKTGAKAKSEPKPEAHEEDGDEGPTDQEVAQFTALRDRIIGDLEDAPDHGEVEATIEMFAEQIEAMQSVLPKMAREIDEAADAARERLAA